MFINNIFVMDIRKQLKYILLRYNATLNSIAVDNAMQTRLSRQVNGGAAITYDTILHFLEIFPDVSAEWLLRGKGEMILSDNLPPILGDESENDLDTHVKLAQAKGEINLLHQEIISLKEKNLKQAGCIEWQKDFISELIAEKTELEKKIPNDTKKDIV